MTRIVLVVCSVALVGCTSKLEGLPAWQNALLADGAEVQWGALGPKYVALSPWKTVGGEDLSALRALFRTPLRQDALKCAVHIDGMLRAGGTEVMVCLGCGQLFAGKKEFVLGKKDELRQVMTKVLGARPAEPNLFPDL